MPGQNHVREEGSPSFSPDCYLFGDNAGQETGAGYSETNSRRTTCRNPQAQESREGSGKAVGSWHHRGRAQESRGSAHRQGGQGADGSQEGKEARQSPGRPSLRTDSSGGEGTVLQLLGAGSPGTPTQPSQVHKLHPVRLLLCVFLSNPDPP